MKNIRSNFVKESLLDYENLANTLKENTSSTVRDLLNEAVRETYNQILSESDEDNEDEYDVEEVEDTNSDGNASDDAMSSENETSETDDNGNVLEDGEEDETDSTEGDFSDDDTETDVEVSPDGNEAEVSSEGTDEDGDKWAEFDKYKVSDDEYDFSNAEDDEIVRVYKLLKDDDQVCVNVDNNKLNIKDNQTGAEYLVDLDSVNNGGSSFDDSDEDVIEDDEDDAFGDEEENNDNFMENTQKIFEIALNEYDSHVGYTDNYQKKDVMTTPDMSEPGKNVNDWDAGVPKSKSKPWSSQKKSVGPFNKGKGKTVEEEEEMEECGNMEAPVEEATNVGGKVQQRSVGAKSHIPNNPAAKSRPYNQHHTTVAGKYETEAEATNGPSSQNEARIINKAKKIYAENKELKNALTKFRNVLQEAAVTNVNLGQIVKLISENATTKAEKQEIIARFGKEAKTVKESQKLYETISGELKKNNQMNINEDKQFTANSSKMINETQIYQSKDLLDSLDMMHRICKL